MRIYKVFFFCTTNKYTHLNMFNTRKHIEGINFTVVYVFVVTEYLNIFFFNIIVFSVKII